MRGQKAGAVRGAGDLATVEVKERAFDDRSAGVDA
jgi:hypothetical protein